MIHILSQNLYFKVQNLNYIYIYTYIYQHHRIYILFFNVYKASIKWQWQSLKYIFLIPSRIPSLLLSIVIKFILYILTMFSHNSASPILTSLELSLLIPNSCSQFIYARLCSWMNINARYTAISRHTCHVFKRNKLFISSKIPTITLY